MAEKGKKSRPADGNADKVPSPPKVRMFRPHVSEAAIARVIETLHSGYIGEGPVVREFEEAFKARLGCPFALAVNSATSALQLAYSVAGIGPGDEVITTAQTMAATSHALLILGAKPVFADIQYDTGNIDPADIPRRLTERTKAVSAVHWAGLPCDMDEIHTAAGGLPVIEDAAHAIGAFYKDRPVGAISPFTCFSFQAIKHITTGDGGMLCMTEETACETAQRRRWYDIDRRNRAPSILGEPIWDMKEPGYKFHMNDIAASLGVVHLEELPGLLARRALIAARYREELADIPGITLLVSPPDRMSANWLFCLHAERREDFARAMRSRGIEVSVVHRRIDTNTVFGPPQDLPNLARFDADQISLPIHNLLSDEEQELVIDALKRGW